MARLPVARREAVADGVPVPGQAGVSTVGPVAVDRPVPPAGVVAAGGAVVLELPHDAVVFLCDRSGIAARPFVEAGIPCVCVDASSASETFPPGVAFVRADVRCVGFVGRPWGVVAFPPCTHLAGVGAGAWARKGEGPLLEGLSVADACLRLARRAVWSAVENPVGRLSHFWGPPDHVFSPHDYGRYLSPPGDAYTKRTCLWVSGSFKMPSPKPVIPLEGSLVAQVEDVERRSETPRGFARALFEVMSPRHPLFAGGPLLPWDASAESLRAGPALRPLDGRPCGVCGRDFSRARSDQVFCSQRCRSAAFRRARRFYASGVNP